AIVLRRTADRAIVGPAREPEVKREGSRSPLCLLRKRTDLHLEPLAVGCGGARSQGEDDDQDGGHTRDGTCCRVWHTRLPLRPVPTLLAQLGMRHRTISWTGRR